MPAIKNKKTDLVFPSETEMSNEELVKVIFEAENGKFQTIDEVKEAVKKGGNTKSQIYLVSLQPKHE